jgi:PAS domain-containing protein
MNYINDEKDRQIIEEQAVTIRLLTDLTKAGSWVINYAPDGTLASVQWGDGFRRLMGYSDQSDFPNELESFMRGIHPEDKDALSGDMTSGVFDENIMRTTGYDFRFRKKDGAVRISSDSTPGTES